MSALDRSRSQHYALGADGNADRKIGQRRFALTAAAQGQARCHRHGKYGELLMASMTTNLMSLFIATRQAPSIN